MVNLVQLDLESITYTDENEKKHDYTVIPVVTLTDDEIDKYSKSEKRLENRWVKFYKTISRKFKIGDDIELSDSEDDPLKDRIANDQYVFTDLTSLASLNFSERDNYNIGLRYIEENEDSKNIAYMFSDDFTDKLIEQLELDEVESIARDIPFSHIKTAYDKVFEMINLISKQNIQASREDIGRTNREQYQENAQDDDEVDDNADEHLDDEFDDDVDEVEQVDDNQQVETTSNEQPPEQGVEPMPNDNTDEPSDIEKLQDNLYDTINNLVPRVYLNSLDMDLSYKNQDRDNQAYAELENVTIETIQKVKQREIERLNEERQATVDRLYRKASSSLYKRFTNIEKLFSYESEESEYHGEYLGIKEKFEQVTNSADTQRDNKFKELTRTFEENMERRAKQAYEQEKARIEREERPLVEQHADEFRDDLIANAEHLYNGQIQNLLGDINVAFESRYYGIVDNVLDEYQSDIDGNVESFDVNKEKTTQKVMDEYNNGMKQLNETIREIEKEHVNNNKQFDERVQLEVDEKTQALRNENKDIKRDYESVQEELERLRRTEKENKATIENLRIENQHKENRLATQEKDADYYRTMYEQRQHRNHMLGHNGDNNNGNFSNVVAPENNNGEGNLVEAVSVEKTKTNIKDKLKSPLVATMIAVSVTSAGLLGVSSFENSNQAKAEENIHEVSSNIDEFKKTNDAKYLGKDTTLTIKADKRLKPSQVVSNDDDGVLVKSSDGHKYKLKK